MTNPLRTFYNEHLRDTAVGATFRAARRAVRSATRAPAPGPSTELGGDPMRGYREEYVRKHFAERLRVAEEWLDRSRETSNFTYDLTPRNEQYLASLLAFALGRDVAEMERYVGELGSDRALRDAIIARAQAIGPSVGFDPTAKFGRRVGWYAFVRAMKPRTVIETGVDKGLGAVTLCAALKRNREEGHPGTYYGTDINPAAGELLMQPYRSMGHLLYGDSIESLTAFAEPIDLFINDSDHSADYEAREYETIKDKLSPTAVVLADNAHVTTKLLEFSRSQNRPFIFFREEPADHWYPGAGIGISLPPRR